MASTPSSRLRLAKQATYDNPETWGVWLNGAVVDLVDDAFGGSAVAVAGNVTLTVENYTEDQARSLFLMLSGAGGFTITVPAVDKLYLVINNCAADVTVTPLAGTGAVVRAGTAVWWYCDGTNGFVVDITLDKIKAPAADVGMNGKKLTNVGAPTVAADAATKGYADTLDTATREYITTLANSTNLGTVAAIAPQVATVAGIAPAVSAVAAIDDETALVASIAGSVVRLAGVTVGAGAADPTARLDGTDLLPGDFYLNTSGTPAVRVYSGAGWVPVAAVTIASQAQAQAGAENTTMMTPLRVAQAVAARGLGLDQSWQSVSRTLATSYQNATPKPIMVVFGAESNNAAVRQVKIEVSADNLVWRTAALGTSSPSGGSVWRGGCSSIVPPGHYYQMSASASIASSEFWELR